MIRQVVGTALLVVGLMMGSIPEAFAAGKVLSPPNKPPNKPSNKPSDKTSDKPSDTQSGNSQPGGPPPGSSQPGGPPPGGPPPGGTPPGKTPSQNTILPLLLTPRAAVAKGLEQTQDARQLKSAVHQSDVRNAFTPKP